VALALLLGGGAHAQDPGFDAVLRRVGTDDHPTVVGAMAAWVAAHPRDDNAGRALIWMAEMKLSDRDVDGAIALFAQAEHDHAGTEWGLHGAKGRADLEVSLHRYAGALETYARLEREPLPYWKYVARQAREAAIGARLRFYSALGLGLALALLVAYRGVRGRKHWAVLEPLAALPVALLMVLGALRQAPPERDAVLCLTAGGMVLLWANAAYLQARPPGRLRAAAEVLLGLAQAAALLFCVVIANDLWMKFFETLVNGAEQ
jgi:hypothetical protein